MKNTSKIHSLSKVFGTFVLLLSLLLSLTPNFALAMTRAQAETAVRNAYRECLGRNPESSGLNHHVNIILGGKRASEVHKDICNSQEAKNYKAKARTSTSSSSSTTSSSSSTSRPSPAACPFPSGTNKYIVSLNQGIRADQALANSRFTRSANIPAGKYNIRVFTWDAHSHHGGQNQNNEQAVLKLYNAAGAVLHTTNRTTDIPANQDGIITTVSTNADLSEAVTQILVYHPEYPSSNPQSLTPVCVEFERIVTPATPTLSASCSVSRTRINAGGSVTFDASISGGSGTYTVNWYGDVNRISGFNRTSRTQSVRINNAGRYYINLEVTDSEGRRSTDVCPVIVVDEDPIENLNVQCEISRSTINRGDYVDIEVFTTGGTRPYYINWSGDARLISGFNRTREYQRVRINDVGTYRLRVDVEDRHGNTGSDICTVRVRAVGGTGQISVISTATPDGELAGLSSVYLSQVPYTGPEDVLKVIGFVSFILIWSATIGFYFLKDKKKKDFSKKIDAYKKANRVRVLAE